jgi:hypothetical protein
MQADATLANARDPFAARTRKGKKFRYVWGQRLDQVKATMDFDAEIKGWAKSARSLIFASKSHRYAPKARRCWMRCISGRALSIK